MDIFAHGLWAGAAAEAANIKNQKSNRKPLNAWLTAFWGIFPDIFAFTILVVWILWALITGNFHLSDVPKAGEGEPPMTDHLWAFNLAAVLYQLSHSAIIFALVFLLVWLISKKPRWEMMGWLLHILIDIPTHTYKFFPTPFLWPISGYKVDGFSWGTPWFLALNYSSLAIVYFLLYRRRKKKK